MIRFFQNCHDINTVIFGMSWRYISKIITLISPRQSPSAEREDPFARAVPWIRGADRIRDNRAQFVALINHVNCSKTQITEDNSAVTRSSIIMVTGATGRADLSASAICGKFTAKCHEELMCIRDMSKKTSWMPLDSVRTAETAPSLSNDNRKTSNEIGRSRKVQMRSEYDHGCL